MFCPINVKLWFLKHAGSTLVLAGLCMLRYCGNVGMAHTHKASKYRIDLCVNVWIQLKATQHGLQILYFFYIRKAVCQGWTRVHAIKLVVYQAAYFLQVKYILQRWTNRGNIKLILSFQYEQDFLVLVLPCLACGCQSFLHGLAAPSSLTDNCIPDT